MQADFNPHTFPPTFLPKVGETCCFFLLLFFCFQYWKTTRTSGQTAGLGSTRLESQHFFQQHSATLGQVSSPKALKHSNLPTTNRRSTIKPSEAPLYL